MDLIILSAVAAANMTIMMMAHCGETNMELNLLLHQMILNFLEHQGSTTFLFKNSGFDLLLL
jgi:hypothetical protein